VSLSLGYVVVLLLSVALSARATGRTFRRNHGDRLPLPGLRSTWLHQHPAVRPRSRRPPPLPDVNGRRVAASAWTSAL
jgi:hypothetical protein